MVILAIYSFTYKVESEEYRMTSANARGSVDNCSSHDANFGGKIGYNVVSYVNQALYGDSGTRFFTRWTADGYVETGCYNTLCEGFVKVANSPLSPGQVLPISTLDEHHDLQIWIEKDHTEDWWLYASTDNSGSGQIGYWPKSLFSRLAQNATDINFGGLVQAIEGSPSPPMGSGHLPNEGSAAYFANVEYVDQSGRKIAGILPSVVTNKNCYDVGDMKDARFSYGGPGGCLRR
ncbi:hypothetical protein FCM35_KLT09486 [Carex littledalei]|uniref:Neprosin PEP catalytic domain-containing protein n=1 Tax=Carex littledalei TaxID=544730 RepID=A0A833RJD8_9POAL|nr:hypothetical protein FCM35_KLT09486 [Carex littledalei]